ncbi:MAG TPA: tripartite tricarboxylate transporter TctB family protein [Geminicoccaceae bacterium]|nr:tripartite tricarboxylate transporter TctB family protein [Geminicoccaceae bacterium]
MWKDVALGGLILVVAVGYYAMANRMQVSSLADEVGPAGVPRVLGLLLMFLGAVLVLRGGLGVVRTRRVGAGPAGAGDAATRPSGEARNEWRAAVRALGLLAMGAAYILLLPLLGYVVSLALLIAASALYLGAPVRLPVAAVAVGGAALFWVIFVMLLGVPLPTGIWARLF